MGPTGAQADKCFTLTLNSTEHPHYVFGQNHLFFRAHSEKKEKKKHLTEFRDHACQIFADFMRYEAEIASINISNNFSFSLFSPHKINCLG